eukprot:1674516-Rhodomonas_salina.1
MLLSILHSQLTRNSRQVKRCQPLLARSWARDGVVAVRQRKRAASHHCLDLSHLPHPPQIRASHSELV